MHGGGRGAVSGGPPLGQPGTSSSTGPTIERWAGGRSREGGEQPEGAVDSGPLRLPGGEVTVVLECRHSPRLGSKNME